MKSSRPIGLSVFLALCGLPFAVPGVGAGGLIYYSLFRWVEVLGWQETPARILTVDVKSGGDSISTEATFEYQWDGERHTGNRVSLYFGSDNIGSFQQRVASELTSYHKSGQSFRCFVDPSDPANSILYRDLRWEMLSFFSVFGTLFGTAGLSLMLGGLMSVPAGCARARLRKQFPAEPWRWNPDWSDGFVRSEGVSGWLTWLAMYWVLVALPGGLGAINAIAHGRLMSVLGLIIPGIAFVIAYLALRRHRQRWFFGRSRVQLDRFPAITGGLMSGAVLIENYVDPRSVWHLTLSCTRETGSGEYATEHVVCEFEQTVDGTESSRDWGQSAVPFEFAIPYTAPQTDLEGHSTSEWTLSVKSERTEREYNDEFDVPVIQTDESSRDFKRDSEVEAQRAQVDERLDDVFPDAALTDARLRIRDHDGTLTVVAPAARYMKPVVGLGLVVLFWDSMCAVLWNVDAPILFPILFSLGGLLITYTWVDLLLSSARVEIGRDAITFRHGWSGLAREHRVERGDIKDVTISSNMSIGSTQYPNVKIHVASGKPMTVMSLIRGRPAADRLAERILEALVRD